MIGTVGSVERCHRDRLNRSAFVRRGLLASKRNSTRPNWRVRGLPATHSKYVTVTTPARDADAPHPAADSIVRDNVRWASAAATPTAVIWPQRRPYSTQRDSTGAPSTRRQINEASTPISDLLGVRTSVSRVPNLHADATVVLKIPTAERPQTAIGRRTCVSADPGRTPPT